MLGCRAAAANSTVPGAHSTLFPILTCCHAKGQQSQGRWVPDERRWVSRSTRHGRVRGWRPRWVTKKLRCSSTTYRLLDQQTCAGCCCISSMHIAALLHGVLAAVRVLCNLRVLAESWGLQSLAPCATRPCLCQLASTPLRHLQQRRLLPLMTYLRSSSRWLRPLDFPHPHSVCSHELSPLTLPPSLVPGPPPLSTVHTASASLDFALFWCSRGRHCPHRPCSCQSGRGSLELRLPMPRGNLYHPLLRESWVEHL